jgi:hypothetical protein
MTRIDLKNTLLLLTFPVFLGSCGHIFGKHVHGNGNVVTQDRSVTSFKNVEVGGAAKVFVSQGDQHSLKVEVDENLQQFVEVFQEGDKIIVRERHGYNIDPTGDLKIYVTSPVYNVIDVSGACDIIGETAINNPEDISMHISGAGTMKMEIIAPSISAGLSGAGNIDLKGETKTADLDLSGAGHAHCFDLKSENTKVEISGAGSAQVFASVRLNAEVSGAGSVDYKGGASVDQHVSGAGGVHKVD